jgi:hypothetical protein
MCYMNSLKTSSTRDDFLNMCTLTPRQFTSDYLSVRGDLILGAPHTNPGYENHDGQVNPRPKEGGWRHRGGTFLRTDAAARFSL